MKKFLIGAVVLIIAVVINVVILQKTYAQDENGYEPPKKAFVRLACAVAAKTEDGVKRVELKVSTHGEGFDTIGNFPPTMLILLLNFQILKPATMNMLSGIPEWLTENEAALLKICPWRM
ncbi:MAG: hypothetical protein UX07_C0040G0009 [Parcubacteria group bacterium GW2011_GWA2_45_30]|nr:MAG: hypothetical protein UX07_C0040G0009 [Parcubacteria group bacterium GW2011_GWA2_45_30]